MLLGGRFLQIQDHLLYVSKFLMVHISEKKVVAKSYENAGPFSEDWSSKEDQQECFTIISLSNNFVAIIDDKHGISFYKYDSYYHQLIFLNRLEVFTNKYDGTVESKNLFGVYFAADCCTRNN